MWTGDVLLNPKMLRYECQKSNFNKKTEKLFLNKIGHFSNVRSEIRRARKIQSYSISKDGMIQIS